MLENHTLSTPGREASDLDEFKQGSDQVFRSTRLDGQTLCDWDFSHCTFVDIGFKNSTLQDGRFLNCTFVSCYFQRSTLANSDFVSCRFIDCNFSRVEVKSSDFKYSTFRRCYIRYDELEHSLPTEPNLKEALARNLFLESRALGLPSEARSYRLAALKAHEDDLFAAIVGKSKWYQDHYDNTARLRALVHLVFSKCNGWFWGYGERMWTLLRTTVLVTFLIFPFLFHLTKSGISSEIGADIEPLALVHFSLENILPTPLASGLNAVGTMAQVFATVESILGLVLIALFASHLFRWGLHR